MKSAEELHFEAVELYWRRYENNGSNTFRKDNSIHNKEANKSSSEDTHRPIISYVSSHLDARNSDTDDSKHLHPPEVEGPLSRLDTHKSDNISAEGPLFENNEETTSSPTIQSFTNGIVNGTMTSHKTNWNAGYDWGQVTSLHQSTAEKFRNEHNSEGRILIYPQTGSGHDVSVDSFLAQNEDHRMSQLDSTDFDGKVGSSYENVKLAREKGYRVEEYQYLNMHSNPDIAITVPNGTGDINYDVKVIDKEYLLVMEQCKSLDSQNKDYESEAEVLNLGNISWDQKIAIELNKFSVLAQNNMHLCEEAVKLAEVRGISYPKLESLLVEKSWKEALGDEFQKPYMDRLDQLLCQEADGRFQIYPPPAKIFNAFNSCPFDNVKVVIIGQDPYHGPGQAMGLCFSVEKGVKFPSSLRNIFLEIEHDLGCNFPSHGNLEKWAYQGVLLMNTVLTVRKGHPNSHAKKGWELFTDAAIRVLVQRRSGIIFLLWGNQAQEKLRLINRTCHHILKAAHPSGVSAYRGFFNCRHFSKANQILIDQGLLPIDWQL
ncbi:hypothetical protein KP509_09G028500 [Ceratopteris richardii]|nr:hypothetical protein KP509_09G028500 [Ceratopteris richardii]KAH7429055.1 hypothetical protein KP509_09G028500 [Ceratopteris richardii]